MERNDSSSSQTSLFEDQIDELGDFWASPSGDVAKTLEYESPASPSSLGDDRGEHRSPPGFTSWSDHAQLVEVTDLLHDPTGLDPSLLKELKEIQLQLLTSKVHFQGGESVDPTTHRIDLDGLCLVGLPGKPLSFLASPLVLDEHLVVCSSPFNAPKFSAGKHSFGFGSSANKYGSGSVCSDSDLPLNGRTRFCCFARYGSWPLFFSHDDEEEKEDFWKRVVIPAVEFALPERKNSKRNIDDRYVTYPWPEQEQFKLNRKEAGLFLGKIKALSLAEGPNQRRFCQTLTMTVKLGQKSTPLFNEEPFEATVGMALQCFNLAGTSCLFWSTGVNLPNENDKNHSFFWSKGFLEKELKSSSRGKANFYPLLGTDSLMSAQCKGIRPVHFQYQDEKLKQAAEDLNVDFQLETWQFYSTFAYLFKDGRGESIPCNPNAPGWRNSSTALSWLLRTLGSDRASGRPDPLAKFLKFLDNCSDSYSSVLRVEPTFYLRFRESHSSNEQRKNVFKLLFLQSAKAVANVYLEASQSEPGSHYCCLHVSVVDRLRTLATCYKIARDRLVSEAEARFTKEKNDSFGAFLSPQEGELLNFLEFSPFFWLTGKSFKVCPRVMKFLLVDNSIRTLKWPALPLELFQPDAHKFYWDMLPKVNVLSTKSKGKWLSQTSAMKYMPQLWFQAKSNPSTCKMKNQIALFLEFASILQKRDDNPQLVVNYFLLLFGYCCLVKSGVDPRLPQAKPQELTPGTCADLKWMYGFDGPPPSGSDVDSEERSDSESESELEPEPFEPSSEDESPLAQLKAVLEPRDQRTLSLEDVKTILVTSPGPLFDLEAAQDGTKRKSLSELLKILFVNPVVTSPTYSCPKQDVWVPALRMLRDSFVHGSPTMQRLRTESTFLGTLLTGWRTYLRFQSFWHCTNSSFAKKALGLFKLRDGLNNNNSIPSNLSAAGSDGPSGPGKRGGSDDDDRLVAHVNAALVDQAIEEMMKKADGRFDVKEMSKHKHWMLVMKACCSAAQRYGSSQKKDKVMVVKFAVICAVRVGQGLGLFSGVDDWGARVLERYDGHVGKLKVKVGDLFNHSPFFKMNGKRIVCVDRALLVEKVKSIASEFKF